MPPTNRDSSLLTKNRQAQTVYTYYNNLNTAVAAGQTVIRQGQTSQNIVIEKLVGQCVCSTVDANGVITYGFNPSACGCTSK